MPYDKTPIDIIENALSDVADDPSEYVWDAVDILESVMLYIQGSRSMQDIAQPFGTVDAYLDEIGDTDAL